MAGKYIALFRGINVGKAKRVAMADLRKMLEELGFEAVHTILNSGNVVFCAEETDLSKLGTAIETALFSKLGVASKVIVLAEEELAAIVAQNPFVETADNPSRLLIAVWSDSVDPQQLKSLELQSWSPDLLAIGERAAYLWCPGGILSSSLAEALGKKLGDAVTTRNWSTIRKIHEWMSK